MSKKVGLTDARIVGLLPPKIGQIEITDSIVAGLRLRVGASGVKTYILRKRIGSKVHNVTLGRHSLRVVVREICLPTLSRDKASPSGPIPIADMPRELAPLASYLKHI